MDLGSNPVSPEREAELIDLIISETVIMHPNFVENSLFYNVNTECQLKYFIYYDPARTSQIYSLIVQNQNRIQQEIDVRVHEMEGDLLLREIVTEFIMEYYLINPVLKNSFIAISFDELSQTEIQLIQDNVHPCEEEFGYFFVTIPILGLLLLVGLVVIIIVAVKKHRTKNKEMVVNLTEKSKDDKIEELEKRLDKIEKSKSQTDNSSEDKNQEPDIPKDNKDSFKASAKFIDDEEEK